MLTYVPDSGFDSSLSSSVDSRISFQISLPMVSKSECEARLRPEFRSRGVNSWNLHSSELCAGGEAGVDTCDGEGGAPLVCIDEVSRGNFFWR